MENGNCSVLHASLTLSLGLRLIALDNLSFVPGGLMENFDSILIQFSLWLVKSYDGQMRGLAWNTISPNKNQIISQWPI